MKNIKEEQLRKAIYMTCNEFENLLDDKYDIQLIVSFTNGLSGYNTSETVDYDAEALCKILSKYFDVNVTSIHIDGQDNIGVWIIYK